MPLLAQPVVKLKTAGRGSLMVVAGAAEAARIVAETAAHTPATSLFEIMMIPPEDRRGVPIDPGRNILTFGTAQHGVLVNAVPNRDSVDPRPLIF
jgi:hypothetical protein